MRPQFSPLIIKMRPQFSPIKMRPQFSPIFFLLIDEYDNFANELMLNKTISNTAGAAKIYVPRQSLGTKEK